MPHPPTGRTNEPGTCLWCGDRLRASPRRRLDGSPRFEDAGPYGDGLFCRLRCGYRFGAAFARAGKRITARTVTPL